MATLTIAISDEDAEFARAQAAHEGCASADDYLKALLRRARLVEARRKLDAKLIEGLESGPAEPVTPEFWESLRREVFEHPEAERRGG